MTKRKTVVICVSLKDERELDELKRLKNSDFLKNASIHFAYIYRQHLYFNELAPYNFPSEQQFGEIKKSAEMILKNLAQNILPYPDECGPIQYHCFLHADPKLKMVSFIREVQADLAVSAMRSHAGLGGLFMSSFTEYLCKFAPCDVLVVKHR